ncbi:MAG: BMP family ABC transporter substrate-binding protein [Spirochaetaceae bacterium]|nr:MAG: BMP family ABC transporter substrate-binding protein [Spirochaetaceae bacterium]
MKKGLYVLLVVILSLSVLGLAACKKKEEEPTAKGEEKIRVALYVNGTLGDKAFFDSADRGMKQAEEEFGIYTKTIEGSYDQANWEPDLAQLAEGDWDIIIAGTWQLRELVEELAPKHPDKTWVMYDDSVDYSMGNLDNVYSILYAQNEGSFLVGALAAMITSSDMPKANPEKVIGFLGGMDISVINDFKVGYIQGAMYIEPEVKVLVSYAGLFNDPGKGKELVLAQYEQGSDIAFNVAAETGLGLLDAAKDKDRYAIGVDSDQYLLFEETDPAKADNIVTSMMKNVDNSLYRAIKLYLDGELPVGQAEVLGIRNGGVGVADNENYQKIVPAEFRDKIKELEEKIISGEIQVDTVF